MRREVDIEMEPLLLLGCGHDSKLQIRNEIGSWEHPWSPWSKLHLRSALGPFKCRSSHNPSLGPSSQPPAIDYVLDRQCSSCTSGPRAFCSEGIVDWVELLAGQIGTLVDATVCKVQPQKEWGSLMVPGSWAGFGHFILCNYFYIEVLLNATQTCTPSHTPATGTFILFFTVPKGSRVQSPLRGWREQLLDAGTD